MNLQAQLDTRRIGSALPLMCAAVKRLEDMRQEQTCWWPRSEEATGAEPGVRREAAHNLALLYRSSGADELARQVLREHFAV